MPFLNPPFIISVLIAVSVHECAHAWVAHRLGDPTPEHAGRLTLNPLAHIDLLGALMFLIVGFGWAKPVPINTSYFRHRKLGTALTALAGPLSNLLLAVVAFVGLWVLAGRAGVASVDLLLDHSASGSPATILALQILRSSLFVNLALMAFNLFPIAPLDGGNIVQLFVPWRYESRYHDFVRIGPFILVGLILIEMVLPIHILSGWVYGIMGSVLVGFQWVMGR